jgi:hypothetical protein
MAKHKAPSRAKPKEPAGDAKPGKQVASEMLPHRFARSSITGGDPMRRTINDYAKNTPADASGAGQIGYTILSMGRN